MSSVIGGINMDFYKDIRNQMQFRYGEITQDLTPLQWDGFTNFHNQQD